MVNEERDLGIVLSSNLKFSGQAAFASSKASSVLGMLKNTFASRDVELWTSLYKTYVRPHLEFAVSAWNPYLKKDKLALEKVQRRATRMPTSIKDFDYETRKDVMGLTSLETRRLRGDLIQFFKITKGLDYINWHSHLTWSEPRAERRAQLRREITTTSNRHNFLTNRIANVWNSLPNDTVNSSSVNEFKSKIDPWLLEITERAAL